MGQIGSIPSGLYPLIVGTNSVGDSNVQDLNSGASNDPIRINSRTYMIAASIIGMQSKPRAGVALTQDIIGAEFSPGINADLAGSSVIAVKADPVLKAGSGNLTSVTGVEANLDFGTSGTRTISGDVAAFSSFLAVPSTYTYSGLVTWAKVRDVNIRSWDAFLNVDSLNTGVTQTTVASGGTSQYLKVYIGTTLYTILMTTA